MIRPRNTPRLRPNLSTGTVRIATARCPFGKYAFSSLGPPLRSSSCRDGAGPLARFLSVKGPVYIPRSAIGDGTDRLTAMSRPRGARWHPSPRTRHAVSKWAQLLRYSPADRNGSARAVSDCGIITGRLGKAGHHSSFLEGARRRTIRDWAP